MQVGQGPCPKMQQPLIMALHCSPGPNPNPPLCSSAHAGRENPKSSLSAETEDEGEKRPQGLASVK